MKESGNERGGILKTSRSHFRSFGADFCTRPSVLSFIYIYICNISLNIYFSASHPRNIVFKMLRELLFQLQLNALK